MNGVQFAARQLKGETAKWSGDFVKEQRVFGAVHPERGIDWEFFQSTAKEEGLKLAPGSDLVYSVPVDTSTASQIQQQEAPTLVAKLKDTGVTTVLLYASYTMTGYLFKAADSLDYQPEWVFPGYGVSDIEITARINNNAYPEQMKHVFGIGTLPPYVNGLEDPQVGWFNWYWGPNTGRVPGVSGGAPVHALRRREPGRAEAHAGDASSRGCSRCRRTAAPRATRWCPTCSATGARRASPTTSTPPSGSTTR